MIRELAILMLGAALLASCGNKYSRIDEYCGTYEGTLPAADGPGIQTTIKLGRDHHFITRLVYLDKKDGVFNEKGTYDLTDNILTLKQDDDELTYFQIEPGQLRRLDMEQQPITGSLADYYILKKVSGCQ